MPDDATLTPYFESRTNDLAVMRGTIATVSPRAKELVAHFYGRLFGRRPELEHWFAAVTPQQQHAKLWAVLNLMATNETESDRYADRFERLRGEHQQRDLSADQYSDFGDVLIASLRYFEGTRWSDEKETVWQTAIASALRHVGSDRRDAGVDATSHRG